LPGKRKIEGCKIAGGLYNMGTSATGETQVYRYAGIKVFRRRKLGEKCT